MAGVSGVVSLAGCLDDLSGDSGPQRRTFELTIGRPGEALEMRIEPSGEVEDVIRINVGDTVVLDITNDAGVAVGFHNHANDEEVVIEPGGEHTMEFEATEEMTGRHEIEGWIDEDDSRGDSDEEDGEHGGTTTTLAVVEARPRGS